MKRRDFLVGSGLFGVAGPMLARAQTSLPCPMPTLAASGTNGTSTTTTCQPVNDALANACAALAAGQSATFSAGNQSAFVQDDLEWQTAFYHDDIHGLIHLMGKPANDAVAWKHQYYTTATGVWTAPAGEQGMWNNDGHIYGNFTMDFGTGDVFQTRSSAGSDYPRRARWWQYSTRSWVVAPVNQDIYSGAMEDHANGVCFHPNLYGPGDGGIAWNEQGGINFWRKSTDATQRVSYSYGTYGDKQGANCYWAAGNCAFVGGNIGAALLRVTPNATAGGTPVLTNMGVPPIETAGNSRLQGGGFGSLHVHPGNPNVLLILETAGPRVFSSTNGSSWTQIANHPFTRMPRVVCALRGGLGTFWAVGNDGSNFSQLWKPAP